MEAYERELFTNQLKDFIAIQSTHESENGLDLAIQYVRDYFADEDVCIQEYRQNKKPSIIISNKNTKNFDLLLNGHIDVIDASEDMFEMHEDDENFYGRGVADMKGGVLALMHAFKKLYKTVDYSLGLMITTDEEIGGFDGVNFLLNSLKYTTKQVIIPDGGYVLAQIESDAKGLSLLKATAFGIPAHGSRPWLGENAIDKIMDFYSKVKVFFPQHNGDWLPTCNLAMIQGGQAMNSVAEQASINIDIRYTDPDEFGRKMLKIHDIAHDMGIEMEEVVNGSSCHLDKEHAYTQLYLDCIKDVTGIEEVQYTRATGGSDGRFFYENGMKVIVHQPTSGAFHSPEEWVNKESLFMYEEIVELYIERFTSQIK